MRLLLVVFIILSYISLAQSSLDRTVYLNAGDNFYYNYFITPSNSDDSLNYTVMFKISHSVLAFNKTEESRMGRTFTATPTVETVFYDSDGIIRNREILTDTITVDKFEDTNDKLLFTGNFITTRLKKSDYKVKMSLLDKYNQKIKKYEFIIKSDFSENEQFSAPFFTKNYEGSEIPIIFNGNLEFSSGKSTLYILTYSNNQNNQILIEKIEKSESEKQYWDKKINYSGQTQITYKIPMLSMAGRLPEVSHINNQSDDYKFAKIEIPSYEFVPGKYKLTLGDAPDTSVFYFNVAWFNKPASLKDIDFAMESMRYILTKEEFKKIDSGDDIEIFRNIVEYWKAKDPTPATPYNEAMAEYFRRVDYSAMNYNTIKEKNGMKTDRGKIYILFGPPSEVNSELKDESSFEIWDYNNRVNKTFTFEMVSSGIFRLIDVKDKSKDSD